MPYEVSFSSPEIRAAAASDPLVTEYISDFGVDPRPEGAKKVAEAGRFELWRMRIGGTRVLYRIDERVKHVTIIGITRRGDPYTS